MHALVLGNFISLYFQSTSSENGDIMTDQMVSQRCRLQARRLAAQRPRPILPRNTKNRQAQGTLPYPSSLIRQSPKSQQAPSKTDKLLTDFPTNACLRSRCYAIDPHTHSYGKMKELTDEGRYSLEIEPSRAGQVMLSPNINPGGLARLDPETDELPTGQVIPSILAPNPAKSKNVDSNLCNVATENDIRISSTHDFRTIATHIADEIRRGGDWHTSLAIRHSLQA